jgi:hypothetical protein
MAAADLLLHIFKYFPRLGNLMEFHQRRDLIIAANFDGAYAQHPLNKPLPQLNIQHTAKRDPVNLLGEYAALGFHTIGVNQTSAITGIQVNKKAREDIYG